MQTATLASPARPPVVIPGGSLSVSDVYFPIDLDGLVVDTVLDFNLYLESGETTYVLFRSPNLPFTVVHRNRLLDNGVRTLYVRGDEQGHYSKYLEDNIGSVLANPEVPARKKATLLYGVSRGVVRDAFEEPRSSAILPRTRRLAAETVDFVLQSERAMAQLASIMATDYYTYTHSINVCVFVVAMAHQCRVDRADIRELAVGALLHDLGKSRVPKDLLNKTGDLTPDELEVMRKHVEWGEALLAQHTQLSPVVMLPVALHHEKLDGSGYPRGLTGDQIHLFGRITALADCFDAMTTRRSYQRAMTGYEALHRMQTVLRGKFDEHLLEAFIRMLRRPE